MRKDDQTGSSTLAVLRDNFRHGDTSEEVTFDQIWIKRTDYVKSWGQEIQAKQTAAEKIIMQERLGSFIDSGKKGWHCCITVCQGKCGRWEGLKGSKNPSHVASYWLCKGTGILFCVQWGPI